MAEDRLKWPVLSVTLWLPHEWCVSAFFSCATSVINSCGSVPTTWVSFLTQVGQCIGATRTLWGPHSFRTQRRVEAVRIQNVWRVFIIVPGPGSGQTTVGAIDQALRCGIWSVDWFCGISLVLCSWHNRVCDRLSLQSWWIGSSSILVHASACVSAPLVAFSEGLQPVLQATIYHHPQIRLRKIRFCSGRNLLSLDN